MGMGVAREKDKLREALSIRDAKTRKMRDLLLRPRPGVTKEPGSWACARTCRTQYTYHYLNQIPKSQRWVDSLSPAPRPVCPHSLSSPLNHASSLRLIHKLLIILSHSFCTLADSVLFTVLY